MKYQIQLLILLLFSFVNAFSQTDSTQIKRDITIEKEYKPTIQPAGKINDIPVTVEPEQKRITPEYGDYTYSVTPTHEITQLDAAELKRAPQPNAKHGYLRLGLGNYWSTLGNFGYDLVSKPKYKLNVGIDHEGTFGKKMHTDNEALIGYHRYYEAGELIAKIGYGYEAFNYYGANSLDGATQYTKGAYQFAGSDFFSNDASINSWKMSLGYKSILSESKKKHFYAGIDYDRFSPNQGLTENQINTHAVYEYKITNGKIGVMANLKNLLYKSGEVDFAEDQSSYSAFFMNPYVDFNGERWKARLGAGVTFSGKGKAFAPVADIAAEVTLVERFLYAYTKIGGDMHTNTMKEMERLNRYINLDEKIKDTYTGLDAQIGLRLKPIYNAIIDFSINYRTIQDQYFFVNDTVRNTITGDLVQSNVFVPQYHDAKLFNTNLTLDYNFNQQMGFNFGWKYNSWNIGGDYEAWQMPQNEFDFGIDLRLGKRFRTEIASYFATGRKAMNIDGTSRSMKSMADINWYFNYAHSSKLYSFLKLNNLINRKYEQWNGYRVNGFNFMVGAVLSF
jgi:hypothetical protein